MIFKGDKVKEFKYALISFVVILILGAMLLITAVVFRSEAFTSACQAVQDNNGKLVIYLKESKHRAFKRIAVEESEGKTPISTRKEISQSIDPLIHTLKPIDC